jgi:hypothetical protein
LFGSIISPARQRLPVIDTAGRVERQLAGFAAACGQKPSLRRADLEPTIVTVQ